MNAFASRMVFSASSALRPRLMTMLRSHADASFSTLLRITGSICPAISTGDAAPVLVPGAMAATSAASRRKNPAEAARPPLGVTYAITGTREATIFDVISRRGVHQSAGSIQANQNRRGIFALGLVDGVADDFDGDGMDDAVDIDRDYLRDAACE